MKTPVPVASTLAPTRTSAPSERRTGVPARIELDIRCLTLPSGLVVHPGQLAELIRQRLQTARDPDGDIGASVPPAPDPVLEALLHTLQRRVLDALHAQGIPYGESR
jgi:hypothetical protein